MKKINIIMSLLLLLGSIPVMSQRSTLSVNDAVNKALEKNYGIVTIKKSHSINEMNNTWGNTGALPTVTFVGNGSQTWSDNNNANYTSTNITGSIDLNWVIFRGFSARITKQNLEKLERLSEGNVAITVENTIIDVILGYYNVLLEKEKVALAEDNMNLSKDRYDQAKQKKELGTSVTYDLLQAQNSYLQDKSDYLSAKSSLKNAKRQLNHLMAEPQNSDFEYTSDFDILAKDYALGDLENKMLSNNNTLKNQYINLEMAKLDVKSAKSAYYPTISAGASGTYSSNDMNYSNNQLDNLSEGLNTSVKLSLSYSIFEGGSRRRALQAAKIKNEIAEVETTEMELQLKNQLAQEFEYYLVRKELVEVAEENLKAAELNMELTKQKYENGSINSFNFRDIQQMYLNTALNYQRSMYNLIQSYYSLSRITGGILDDYNN